MQDVTELISFPEEDKLYRGTLIAIAKEAYNKKAAKQFITFSYEDIGITLEPDAYGTKPTREESCWHTGKLICGACSSFTSGNSNNTIGTISVRNSVQ